MCLLRSHDQTISAGSFEIISILVRVYRDYILFSRIEHSQRSLAVKCMLYSMLKLLHQLILHRFPVFQHLEPSNVESYSMLNHLTFVQTMNGIKLAPKSTERREMPTSKSLSIEYNIHLTARLLWLCSILRKSI